MENLRTETATLAGGCFWCLEAVFENLDGVKSVVSGYAGGPNPRPTYEQVCSGRTGHAEAVQITFDPETISYREILEVFFGFHDPTTLNRQGPDVGTQYRSAIYYHSPEQKRIADEIVAELTRGDVYGRPIVTEITAAPEFYAAEGYHQGYFRQNPGNPYCQAVVAPKVAKLRSKYAARLKA